VIDEPFAAAADQESVALPLPPVTAVSVGAPGSAAGVAESEFDGEPVPAEFAAVTVKEYVVPFVSPATVQPRPAVVQVKPPGDDVAV
jgi:hypothetical protein